MAAFLQKLKSLKIIGLLLVMLVGMGNIGQGQVSHLVISQVYGGGGNSGASYTNDFVEIFNPTNASVSITNWSIQYQTQGASTWSNVGTLSGSIAAGKYYLIQLASSGAVGSTLPTPDLSPASPTNLSATQGKIALVNSTTVLTSCADITIVDKVGYGTTSVTCNETSNAPAPSSANSIQRAGSGCVDNNNNSTDFSSASPIPRNNATAANVCTPSTTNYYLKANTDPTVANNWGIVSDGSGANPTNINIANAIWNVTENSNTPTTNWANSWTLGSGSSILVKASSTFNIAGTLVMGGQQISAAGASATINTTANGNVSTTNTAGFSGTTAATISSTNSPTIALNSASTVNYNGFSGSTVTALTYGNLTISGTGTYTFGGTSTVAGNYTQSAASTVYLNNGSTGFNLSVTGNFALSAGTFVIQNTTGGLGSTVTVAGITGTTISGTGSLLMDVGAAIVANKSIFQTTNFTASNTSSSTAIIIDFGNSGSIKANEFRISGNCSKTGTNGRFYTAGTPVNGGFVFNGTGTTQTLSIVASASTEYYNVTINSGALVQLTSVLTLGTASNPVSIMTVNGTLDCQALAPAVNGGTSGTFLLASGGTLKTANTVGIVSGTTGSISTSILTRTFNSGANYEFSGSSAITATNFVNTTMNNLTISNTAGVTNNNGNLTLSGDLTITGLFIPGALDIISGSAGSKLLGTGTARVTRTLGTSQFADQYPTLIYNGSVNSPTIEYIGTAAQTIPTANFSGLKISNTNGVSMSADVTVAILLTLNTGTLSIGSHVLNLTGGVTRTSGTLSGTSSSALVMESGFANSDLAFAPGAQSLSTLSFGNYSGSGTAILNSALDIYTSLTFTPVNLATFNLNGQHLTLKSSAIKTAYIGTVTGTLSGASNVTVERYIPANTTSGRTGKAWRLLTAPITSNTLTVNAAWQEGMTSNNTLNYTAGTTTQVSIPTGYGTRITGQQQGSFATANPRGYDFWNEISNSSSSIRRHNGLGTGAWINLETDGGAYPIAKLLSSEQGYLVYIRGDRNIYNQATGTSTTLRATGTLKQGTISTIPVIPSGTATYTLVGNPYASPIDFDKIYLANTAVIQPMFTIWDANLNTTGGYRLVTRTAQNTYTVNPQGSVDVTKVQFIQSGQAFFMQGTSAGGTLSIQESHKATNGTDLVFLKVVAPVPALNIDLSIKNADNSLLLADGAVIRFSKKYTKPVTGEDVRKAFNFAENLAVAEDTFTLISDSRPLPAKKDTVYLKLWGTAVKNYQFAIDAAAFTIPGLTAQLKDKYLNTSTPLTLDGSITTVNFSINTDSASKATDRFYIVFRKKAAALSASASDELIAVGSGMKVYPNPATGGKFTVSINNLAKGSYEIVVFNTGGQKILSRKIEHAGGAVSENIILTNRSNGVYNIRLTDANGVTIKTLPIIINR